MRLKSVSTYILLSILLAGGSANASQYFGDSFNSSTKMTHHTKIFIGHASGLTDVVAKSSSNVDFENEEIISQKK